MHHDLKLMLVFFTEIMSLLMTHGSVTLATVIVSFSQTAKQQDTLESRHFILLLILV